MATKKDASQTAEKTAFKVLENLHHDGDAYTLGDKIELTAEEAAPLLASGVVAKAGKPAADKPAE
jgi:hypothetical protein